MTKNGRLLMCAYDVQNQKDQRGQNQDDGRGILTNCWMFLRRGKSNCLPRKEGDTDQPKKDCISTNQRARSNRRRVEDGA